MTSKVALLIDAENISYKLLPQILEKASRHGQIVLQAAYGDWQNSDLQNWREAAEQNGFEIRHQNSNKMKNTTDMKLVLDAGQVLYRESVEIFCIVANDAHYVPLCDHIHEYKKYVIGIGNPDAADPFIRNCDEFIFIGRDKASVQPPIETLITATSEIPPAPPKQPAPTQALNPPAIRKLLKKAFAAAPQDANGWVGLPALGSALRQVQPDFQNTSYGHTTLSKILQSMPDFVEVRVNGTEASARLKK